MSQWDDRIVYALEREGSCVYCSSFGVASALLSMGWTLRAMDRWARVAQKTEAGPPGASDDRSC